MSSLEELGLEGKDWRSFKKKYYAANKEDSWQMLLDEYWEAKKMFDRYTDGTTNNMIEWLTYKNFRESLEIEILRRTMEENGYKN